MIGLSSSSSSSSSFSPILRLYFYYQFISYSFNGKFYPGLTSWGSRPRKSDITRNRLLFSILSILIHLFAPAISRFLLFRPPYLSIGVGDAMVHIFAMRWAKTPLCSGFISIIQSNIYINILSTLARAATQTITT